MNELKFSKYNLPFDFEGRYYLYNTLSTAILDVDDNIFNCVVGGKAQLLTATVRETLIEKGFLVKKDLDEANAYLYYFDKYRYIDRLNKINLTIITSYLCNLNCTYCNQGSDKINKKILDKPDVPVIFNFLKKIISESVVKIQQLHINFFGGEPLLAKVFCLDFARIVSDFCQQQNITLAFSIATNGVLLNKSLIETFIKPYNISVQLTIDGLNEKHDSKRKDFNGKGTFNNTIKLIDLLIDNGLKQNIILRAHIDKETISCAEDTLNFFKSKCGDFYFSYLIHYKQNNDEFEQNCIESNCLIYHNYYLTELILKNNMNYRPSFGKRLPCSLCIETSFLVDAELDVYKCTILANKKEHRIGTLSASGNLEILPDLFQQMQRTPSKISKCLDCVTLPTCAGGCAAKSLYENDSLYAPLCEVNEEMLIAYLKDYIKLSEKYDIPEQSE